MSFSKRLTDYIFAVVDNAPDLKHLFPARDPQRIKRMDTRTTAIDWRLQVQDQAAEVRKTIRDNRSVGILQTEVEVLLYLLDEHDKDRHRGN